jgi:hypothetical protein
MGIEIWSTTAANNNSSNLGSPEGISGTDNNSVVDDVIRQHMADHKTQWLQAEWFEVQTTPTYISATSFSFASDVTTSYYPGRRIKMYGTTMGTFYGDIISASYSAPNTTITVRIDGNNSLTSNLSKVYLATSNSVNYSQPLFISYPYPNILYGGNFDTNPWQRGTSFTGIGASSVNTADRFQINQSGSGVLRADKDISIFPNVANVGFLVNNSLKISCTTSASVSAGNYSFLVYRLEGYEWNQIGHVYPTTISFWARASLTGTYCIFFQNSGADRSYVSEITISSANTWSFYSITVPQAPTGGTWDRANGIGLAFGVVLACGSTYQTTANTWATGNYFATSNQVNFWSSTSNNIYFANLKLNPGSYASTLPWRSPQEELMNSMRYYQKTFPIGTAPAQATSIRSGSLEYTVHNSGSVIHGVWMNHLPMRATPTVTTYSVYEATANWWNVQRNAASGASSGGSITTSKSEKSVFIPNGQVAADSQDQEIIIHVTLDASLS